MAFFSYIYCFFFSCQSSDPVVLKSSTDVITFSLLHLLHLYSFQNFSFTALYKLAPQQCVKSLSRRTYESYCNLLSVRAFLLTTNVLQPTLCFQYFASGSYRGFSLAFRPDLQKEMFSHLTIFGLEGASGITT